MDIEVYSFKLNINWKLINFISQIDRFDASWTAIERREGQSLKELKNIATVRSVGASNRIEGNRMSDEEVDVLLQKIDITKLTDRDSQEVVGYFEVLDLISESYENINLTESHIKSLHNSLLRYSDKDQWHKGNYKAHSNAVEASFPDGTREIIFQTTEAGFATEDAIRALLNWYNSETEIHPLIKIASFVYDFLSIHPFQDGNGRLSRLVSTLLLLKNGYKWIQYVSFEHEIENRKNEYYQVLRSCQAKRPHEDITVWIQFFLSCISNIQSKLLVKLNTTGVEAQISPKEKSIFTIIQNRPNIQSGEISEKLAIPLPTVKRVLSELVNKGLIEKQGSGRNVSYTI
ncbi:Filamentation induced by cAMP protein Fic [Mariniradius saccharolyticus AK6]|uniref:Filamentation induced by cAMP protein Fic n=1 Tax=Mariniradius saccharolyticus AK6 TaxID=1239962 RepID=M7Y258_9BACT|nr:Fic family protein [Mariniradius saccharolyticus]EMS31296.1 Filamentation induced by cAMP protein Fic [Mariniradius saccharolyticus AK6]